MALAMEDLIDRAISPLPPLYLLHSFLNQLKAAKRLYMPIPRWLRGKSSMEYMLHSVSIIEILETISKSLRTFIHAKKSSAGDFRRLLQFFTDLLPVLDYNFRLKMTAVKILSSCFDQATHQIRLENLLAHLFSSFVVVSFLFEYLMGYIERGVWATYSDTSWEFRATYVSIELRLAAYFWFKFRAWPAQPSSADRGRKRSRAELKGTPSVSNRNERNKFEPRLRAYLRAGDKKMELVWLGEYDTRQEAEDVYWIGAFYYDLQKRLSDDVLSWCTAINLLPLPPNLSVQEKKSSVRRQAEDYLTRRRHQDQGAVAVEQYEAAGYVVPATSGTREGGNLSFMDDSLLPPWGDIEFMLEENMRGGPCEAECTGIGLGQRDSEDVTVDEYIVGAFSTQGEVAGQGVGNEGLDLPRTCRDQSVRGQQDVQHVQQSHRSAIVLEGGGAAAEVGAIRQDETEEHSALGASSNHTQAIDLPVVARELEKLKFTDTIRSTFRDIRDRGWNFKIQPCVSPEFSVGFTNCQGQQCPQLTELNIFAFEEIYEQGFEIILEPISSASPQDGNVSPQSGSGSQNLCRSCNARLSVE